MGGGSLKRELRTGPGDGGGMPRPYYAPCDQGKGMPPVLPLCLLQRLLDWCIESDEGHLIGEARSCCWNWTGYVDSDGYGEIKFRGRKYRAHRVAFAAFGNRLLDGTDIDHACRNRACVNPLHLTQVDPLHNRVILRDARGGAV